LAAVWFGLNRVFAPIK